jgi:hypothetical protein
VFEQQEIKHAIRFTAQITRKAYVAPARHWASTNLSVDRPPMGMRVRLKALVDISGYSPAMQVILRAMKKYGLILADNGSDMYITGTYDTRWNNSVLNPAFAGLTASDFEVIQLGYNPPASTATPSPAASATATVASTITATQPPTTPTATRTASATPTPVPPTATAAASPTSGPPTATRTPTPTNTPRHPPRKKTPTPTS